MEHPSSGTWAFRWMCLNLTIITISSGAFILETEPAFCCGRYDATFKALEAFCVVVFTLDYFLRLFTSPAADDAEYDAAAETTIPAIQITDYLISRFRFMLRPLNIIDLLAILPFYIELAILSMSSGGEANNSFLTILRVGRTFRLVKLGKYSKGMTLLAHVMSASLQGLGMLLVLGTIAVTLFSCGIFYAERGTWCGPSNSFCDNTAHDGPGWYYAAGESRDSTYTDGCPVSWCRQKSDFDSVFSSGYWTITTVTTTGYGDMVPKTVIGKMLGCIIMLAGLVVIALPITVISTNFAEAYEAEEFLRIQQAASASVAAQNPTEVAYQS